MRDVLMRPSWRSSVIVETLPAGVKWLGRDRLGWSYYLDGRRILAKFN